MSIPETLTTRDSETIRDALYLASVLIHKEKIIVNPSKETLSEDRIERVLKFITIDRDE